MPEADPRKAANLLRRRLLKNPRDLEALLTLASQLEAAGQVQEAEILARKAHRFGPTGPSPSGSWAGFSSCKAATMTPWP